MYRFTCLYNRTTYRFLREGRTTYRFLRGGLHDVPVSARRAARRTGFCAEGCTTYRFLRGGLHGVPVSARRAARRTGFCAVGCMTYRFLRGGPHDVPVSARRATWSRQCAPSSRHRTPECTSKLLCCGGTRNWYICVHICM
jgi:hypothetical protein